MENEVDLLKSIIYNEIDNYYQLLKGGVADALHIYWRNHTRVFRNR